jgi:tetratricopeptide (TPR) repeat protein
MMTSAVHGAAGETIELKRREAQRALSLREFKRAHELCIGILQEMPMHADAMFMLGMIAVEHGSFAKAVEVIGRAIALDPARAEYHAQLGRCLIVLLRPAEAVMAAERALRLDPTDALTLDTIGVVMTRAGQHANSVEPYRRAVSLDPSRPYFHYNLGAALQIVGDFPGAQAALKEALRIDPTFYRAWSSLAQVSRTPFTEAELNQLHTLAEQAPTADAELHIRHALAKHFEDVGAYPRAFQQLNIGKRRKCLEVRYQSGDDAALFDAVKRVCSSGFLRRNDPACDSSEPIFIFGMPRTGTTLVERILSSHPDVYSAGELTNFALVMKGQANTQSNLVLDVETLAASDALDWRALGEEYVASTRPRTGHTKHFIDKMPLNFLYAGFIAKALPNAKIICVRRNPVDTCLSNYRQLFATQFPYYNYSYDLLDTGRYYAMFDALIRYWREHIPRNFIEVGYESVVADTEGQARRLVEFCGLEWNDACLNFHENAAPVSTASSVQVRQPIYKTSVERWRKYEKETAELRLLLTNAGLHI